MWLNPSDKIFVDDIFAYFRLTCYKKKVRHRYNFSGICRFSLLGKCRQAKCYPLWDSCTRSIVTADFVDARIYIYHMTSLLFSG